MVNHQSLDATFAALSDPTRRAIVARLARGGAAAGELAQPFAMSLPGFMKHVAILERAGLVAREKQGRVVHCTLRPQALKPATDWLDRYRKFWDERLDALERFLDQPETPTWQPPPTSSKDTPSPSRAASKPRRTRSGAPGPTRKR
jgi:DNA-binding transcriptional ArsR family regulator